MYVRKIAAYFSICLLLSIIFAANSYAQEDDVKSLGEILNERPDGATPGLVTGQDFANAYYDRCQTEYTDVFTPSELQTLCTCMAAKMSETLTVEEFKVLYNRGLQGENARSKSIAFAHLPCMMYVVDTKVMRECRNEPVVRRLVTGKNTLCACTVKRYKKHIAQNASFISRSARIEHPMSLNPLAIYFESEEHRWQIKHLTKDCKFDIDYYKYN